MLHRALVIPAPGLPSVLLRQSALIEAVLAGEQVVVEKSGQPIARLVRYQGAAAPRRPGALKGRIKIAEDFDELPDDIAEAFAAR